VGKLHGKVAVITGATSGMALACAQLFVDEGAHVFISGRRKDALDQAVELIGRNVTGMLEFSQTCWSGSPPRPTSANWRLR